MMKFNSFCFSLESTNKRRSKKKTGQSETKYFNFIITFLNNEFRKESLENKTLSEPDLEIVSGGDWRVWTVLAVDETMLWSLIDY
jgi:hypothetical protein